VLRPTRRHSHSLLGILAIITAIGLVWPAGIAAGTRTGAAGGPSVAAPAHSDRSPSVRGLGVKSLDAGRGHRPSKPLEQLNVNHADRGKIVPGLSGTGAHTPAGTTGAVPPASVVATNSGAPAADSFVPVEGLAQADTAGPLEPPDPWVAAGPNDVVQTVNENLRFMNREGTATAGNIDMFEFFDLANFEVSGSPLTIDGIADPRWMYDVKHDRWLGETLGWHCDSAGSTGFIFGAISLTGDPTGDYYNFYILYEGFLPDYPMVGTSGDKFTISANEFDLPALATNCTDTATFDAASLTTFDWADMLTFPASPDFTYDFFPNPPGGPDAFFTLRPAVSPQGASNTLFVVGELPVSGTTSNVIYFKVTGTNAAGTVSVSTPIDLTAGGVVSPFVEPPAPDDPGSPLPAGIVDRRPTDAIWQDNVITVPTTVPCPSLTEACARVFQLNTGPATPTLRQDFLVPGAPAGSDTWYPGVGQSQSGILHVVYTQSSATDGMSSLDRYQGPSDGINTLSDVREIADGAALGYNGTRWGDYVGVAQDPRDTNAVWQANQYTKSASAWGTRVSELQTPGATFVPVTPVRVLSSRDGIGLSGKFVANVARTIVIGNGIPADAVAITGNLTVTEQNAAGFLAVTPTPNNTPSTSTLNFPLGDNRANNVTTPLSTTGAVSIVYKAIAGKTTHVILDVTGYYTNVTSGSTYKTVTPDRSLDTRDGTGGLSGKFVHGVVRNWLVRGRNGIPNDPLVIAVTGNLTVTGQTTRGFATVGPNVASNPATSTLNIPMGDTRANGITVGLSGSGRLEAVFRGTTSTAAAHLIFDVTGYFIGDLTGARFVPLTPGRRMDTRAPAPPEGLSGLFTANVARTLVIESYQGIPLNATAIAGNLTVVGQNHAGFVAMTPNTTNSPPNSSLNFPVGDIRANGVIGPLSAAGNVGLVFKTTMGTTHLILDLTGYFR
jgi:hypothetical protein